MRELCYGSVCSGIEAASIAWEPLGMRPAWFAEIEPFPSAVLAHRWPHVANLGDMTKLAKKVLAGDTIYQFAPIRTSPQNPLNIKPSVDSQFVMVRVRSLTAALHDG